MIPSEFNQDVMAQRRKLHMLHEARVSSLDEAKFKIGDRVKLTGKSGQTQKKNGFSITGKINKAQMSSGRDFFRVGWDDGKNSSIFDLQSRLGLDIVKEEAIVESVTKPFEALVSRESSDFAVRFNVWIVKFDFATRKVTSNLLVRGGGTKGHVFKAIVREAKKRNLKILDFGTTDKQFKKIAEKERTKFEETLYEAPQGPTKDSWLTTAKVGGLFNVFRVDMQISGPKIERLPGLHKSKKAANKAALAIGEKTGEELRKS